MFRVEICPRGKLSTAAGPLGFVGQMSGGSGSALDDDRRKTQFAERGQRQRHGMVRSSSMDDLESTRGDIIGEFDAGRERKSILPAFFNINLESKSFIRKRTRATTSGRTVSGSSGSSSSGGGGYISEPETNSKVRKSLKGGGSLGRSKGITSRRVKEVDLSSSQNGVMDGSSSPSVYLIVRVWEEKIVDGVVTRSVKTAPVHSTTTIEKFLRQLSRKLCVAMKEISLGIKSSDGLSIQVVPPVDMTIRTLLGQVEAERLVIVVNENWLRVELTTLKSAASQLGFVTQPEDKYMPASSTSLKSSSSSHATRRGSRGGEKRGSHIGGQPQHLIVRIWEDTVDESQQYTQLKTFKVIRYPIDTITCIEMNSCCCCYDHVFRLCHPQPAMYYWAWCPGKWQFPVPISSW